VKTKLTTWSIVCMVLFWPWGEDDSFRLTFCPFRISIEEWRCSENCDLLHRSWSIIILNFGIDFQTDWEMVDGTSKTADDERNAGA
jgi:hypothetical protein